MNVYDFRSGRSIKNVDPQEVGETLERIRTDKGRLVPADVLDEAANPDSPLHAAFEWDDSAAAKKHRLGQARHLITSIRVLNSPTARPVTAFVSVRTPSHGHIYMPMVEAMSDEELRVRVLADLRGYIESMERRYAHFVGVGELLASLKQKVG